MRKSTSSLIDRPTGAWRHGAIATTRSWIVMRISLSPSCSGTRIRWVLFLNTRPNNSATEDSTKKNYTIHDIALYASAICSRVCVKTIWFSKKKILAAGTWAKRSNHWNDYKFYMNTLSKILIDWPGLPKTPWFGYLGWTQGLLWRGERVTCQCLGSNWSSRHHLFLLQCRISHLRYGWGLWRNNKCITGWRELFPQYHW